MLLGGDTTVSFRHELAGEAIEPALTAGERVEANRGAPGPGESMGGATSTPARGR